MTDQAKDRRPTDCYSVSATTIEAQNVFFSSVPDSAGILGMRRHPASRDRGGQAAVRDHFPTRETPTHVGGGQHPRNQRSSADHRSRMTRRSVFWACGVTPQTAIAAARPAGDRSQKRPTRSGLREGLGAAVPRQGCITIVRRCRASPNQIAPHDRRWMHGKARQTYGVIG
jgi:hypothetical protein